MTEPLFVYHKRDFRQGQWHPLEPNYDIWSELQLMILPLGGSIIKYQSGHVCSIYRDPKITYEVAQDMLNAVEMSREKNKGDGDLAIKRWEERRRLEELNNPKEPEKVQFNRRVIGKWWI